jgi:hypothetical protein
VSKFQVGDKISIDWRPIFDEFPIPGDDMNPKENYKGKFEVTKIRCSSSNSIYCTEYLEGCNGFHNFPSDFAERSIVGENAQIISNRCIFSILGEEI